MSFIFPMSPPPTELMDIKKYSYNFMYETYIALSYVSSNCHSSNIRTRFRFRKGIDTSKSKQLFLAQQPTRELAYSPSPIYPDDFKEAQDEISVTASVPRAVPDVGCSGC
jgi:hypothetical protein